MVGDRVDHVGQVTHEGDDIDVFARAYEPVIVRQAVVQVRHDEDPHPAILSYDCH